METQNRPLNVGACRDAIMDLAGPIAGLCKAVHVKSDLLVPMTEIILGLLKFATVSGLNLPNAIIHKLTLNGRKYPVGLCKVKELW